MEDGSWIQPILGLIGAGSLCVGVFTYIRSQSEIKQQRAEIKKQRDDVIIRNWQRVAIYKAIADGNAKQGRPIELTEIKKAYVAAALEFRDLDIPKDEIQDSALQRVLMSLIENQLIEMMENGRYRLVFVSSWEEKLKTLELIDLAEKRLGELIVISLNKSSIRYDKGDLWNEINQMNRGEYSYPSYLYVIQRMIASGMLVVETAGTLSLAKEGAKFYASALRYKVRCRICSNRGRRWFPHAGLLLFAP